MEDKKFNSETGNESNQDSQANNSSQENQIGNKTASFTKSSTYNDEDYVHYSYKIINKVNGKYYIGIHSFSKDLGYKPENDGYWGSGTKIQEAIKNEGRSNFRKEILKIFSTRQELSNEEKRLVTIKEVNNPMCYNATLGGDDNFENNLGWVVCRPKSAIDKIVKIPRKEYYENKDLFVPTGHVKHYLKGLQSKDNEQKHSGSTMEKNWIQKIDKEDTLYSRRRDFVNKTTLEIKTFIGHDEPDKLYEEWFPVYFYNKIDNCFISKEYFENEYRNLPNMEKLAIKFGINKKYIKELKSYYISKGSILDESNRKRKPYINRGVGFSGKTFVNKGGKTIPINRSELQKYLDNGYNIGKYISLSEADVYSFYTKGNSLKKTSEKFSTSKNKIKQLLGLDDNPDDIWFHNDEKRESMHLLVKDSKMKNDILGNKWIEGRKNY